MKIDIDKKYQTRSGLPVRLISNNGRKGYPILGVVTRPDGSETVADWTDEGEPFRWAAPRNDGLDLVPIPVPPVRVVVWLDDCGTPKCLKEGHWADLFCKPQHAKVVELKVPT